MDEAKQAHKEWDKDKEATPSANATEAAGNGHKGGGDKGIDRVILPPDVVESGEYRAEFAAISRERAFGVGIKFFWRILDGRWRNCLVEQETDLGGIFSREKIGPVGHRTQAGRLLTGLLGGHKARVIDLRDFLGRTYTISVRIRSRKCQIRGTERYSLVTKVRAVLMKGVSGGNVQTAGGRLADTAGTAAGDGVTDV